MKGKSDAYFTPIVKTSRFVKKGHTPQQSKIMKGGHYV